MRVAITGGAGFLGYHLAQALAPRGHEVTLYDVAPLDPSEYPASVRSIRGDVRKVDEVDAALGQADAVIHAAAALPLWKRADIPHYALFLLTGLSLWVFFSSSLALSARSLLDSVSYELLLADGRLPDGTGMELAERAEASGAKILIITGYAFQLADDNLARYDFLMKPVRPAELIQAIGRILGKK